jgi:hypothetical protein
MGSLVPAELYNRVIADQTHTSCIETRVVPSIAHHACVLAKSSYIMPRAVGSMQGLPPDLVGMTSIIQHLYQRLF